MAFFRTRMFVASISFLAGMWTMWMWSLPVRPLVHRVLNPDPMEELRHWQDSMVGSLGKRLWSSLGGVTLSDLRDEGDRYVLEVHLNGLQPGNFSVQVEDGSLVLQGTLQSEQSEDGSFQTTSQVHQSFPVPDDVDPTRVQMENVEGRLRVILPKRTTD